MDADFDTTNLQALREELKRLNASALESGLIAVRDGRPVMPRRRASGGSARRGLNAEALQVRTGDTAEARKPSDASKPSKSGKTSKRATAAASPTHLAPSDTGKAGARRLLDMAGRREGDGSPSVPGTDFTEAGIVRLLAHLRKRRSRGFQFLQRLHRFLTRPVAMGTHTSAGISVERLQLVARQLHEIEAQGWHQFRLVRAARRGRLPAPAANEPSRAPRPRKTKAAPAKTGPAKTALTKTGSAKTASTKAGKAGPKAAKPAAVAKTKAGAR